MGVPNAPPRPGLVAREPAVTAGLSVAVANATAVAVALQQFRRPAGLEWLDFWLPFAVFVLSAGAGFWVRARVRPTAAPAEHRRVPAADIRTDGGIAPRDPGRLRQATCDDPPP